MKPVKPFAERRGTPLPAGGGYLLAIDPGAHTGWALFNSTSLLACGIGEPPTERASRVVIELPQVYPQQPVPPNDLITLAFLAGRYAGRAMGVVATVFPHQWKGNLPKDARAARVRAQMSPGEQKLVDGCGVPKKQMHNVMDAVGIGFFFIDATVELVSH